MIAVTEDDRDKTRRSVERMKQMAQLRSNFNVLATTPGRAFLRLVGCVGAFVSSDADRRSISCLALAFVLVAGRA
jgi:hypothetical protein